MKLKGHCTPNTMDDELPADTNYESHDREDLGNGSRNINPSPIQVVSTVH